MATATGSDQTPAARLGDRTAPVVLVVWTLLVWGGRVRNILADDELTDGERTSRLVLALLFVVVAGLLGLALAATWRRPDPLKTGVVKRLAFGLSLFGIAVWTIRGIDILLDSYDLGFKVVHTALAIFTFVLSAWTIRQTRTT